MTRALGLWFGIMASACVLPSDPVGVPSNAIKVGALLPFTGEAAATGTNIERALIMAVDEINAAGGIAGQPLVLRSRDTHSDTARGLAAARELFDEGIAGLIGPEEEDLANRLVREIRDRRIVQVAAGVTSPTFTIADDDGFWFRTNPSSRIYGRALAERIDADGVRRVAILAQDDEYGTGFASVLVNELVQRGVSVGAPVAFQPDRTSYLDVLARARETEPQALVLITNPRTGAALTQEWAILGGTERWYLAHSLKSQVFIDNIPPGALEGAIGVSVEVAGDEAEFREAFAARWSGDEPLDAAYFYYDAMALLALSIAAAGGAGDGAAIRDQVTTVSRPPGRVIAWYELEAGLAALAAGEEIDYRGASGDVDLDSFGDLEAARVVYWGIEGDRIVER